MYLSNLSQDIPGYVDAPANALDILVEDLIGGHLGRLGTRADVAVHQEYMADIAESVEDCGRRSIPLRTFRSTARTTGPPSRASSTPTAAAAQPVIEKYTGVLGAADVFTEEVAFWLMESIRLDLGYGCRSIPDLTTPGMTRMGVRCPSLGREPQSPTRRRASSCARRIPRWRG